MSLELNDPTSVSSNSAKFKFYPMRQVPPNPIVWVQDPRVEITFFDEYRVPYTYTFSCTLDWDWNFPPPHRPMVASMGEWRQIFTPLQGQHTIFTPLQGQHTYDFTFSPPEATVTIFRLEMSKEPFPEQDFNTWTFLGCTVYAAKR